MSIDVERREAVALVTINRPEALNTLDIDHLDELHDAVEALENDQDVRALVLTGAGEKAFAAGADIRYMRDLRHGCARGARVECTRPRRRTDARDNAKSDDRGSERICARWRLRDGSGVRHSARVDERAIWTAEDRPRSHSWLGWNRSACTCHLSWFRQGVDLQWSIDRCR